MSWEKLLISHEYLYMTGKKLLKVHVYLYKHGHQLLRSHKYSCITEIKLPGGIALFMSTASGNGFPDLNFMLPIHVQVF